MNSTKKYNRTHEYYQKKAKNLNKLMQIRKSQNTLGFIWLEGWKSRKMEKLEDKKDFIFSHFLFGWGWKSREIKNMSLNKFTHILLLKNDVHM